MKDKYNFKKNEDFSKKIGVKNIFRHDFNRPGEYTVYKICKFFNVTEEWLSEYQTELPHENSSAPPESPNGTKGIVVYGYEFRNKRKTLKCIKLLRDIEQLDADLFDHTEICLQMLLDSANIMVKKTVNLS